MSRNHKMPEEKKYRYMKGVHSFLRVFLFFYTQIFSIRSKVSKEVKDLNEPYLLLGNHMGTWDPFVIGYFLDEPIHFVSSDAVFRDRFMRFILTRMGVIPKKKNVKDTRVVRIMMSHIKGGMSIGLFPEASRSWTGRTMNIDPATAKLVKLLNAPVVIAKMKGMQLFNPRWGTKLRRSKVLIEYELCFQKEELKTLSENAILEKIRKDLYHNEVEYQRKEKNKLHSSHRAEYISYVLFTCPQCEEVGHIRSKGNKFSCNACHSEWNINDLGFFEGVGHNSKFDNIIDWFDWQLPLFEKFVYSAIENKSEKAIFSDNSMIVFKENKKGGFNRIGKCDMHFYIDRVEFDFKWRDKMILPIADIHTLSPQLRERIEINYGDKAYRVLGRPRGTSGLKWEMACNTVWKSIGQEYKLSSYFKGEK